MIKDIFQRRLTYCRYVKWTIPCKLLMIALFLFLKVHDIIFFLPAYAALSIPVDGGADGAMYLMPVDRSLRKKMNYIKALFVSLDSMILFAMSVIFPVKVQIFGNSAERFDINTDNLLPCICAYITTFIFVFNFCIGQETNNSLGGNIYAKKKAGPFTARIISFVAVLLAWSFIEDNPFSGSYTFNMIFNISVYFLTVIVGLVYCMCRYKIGDYADAPTVNRI